jgi:hypothetical protein
MTLPEVCPLDVTQTCKGRECHLFCLEWRTREPTCLIGYNATSQVRSGRDERRKDTYAEDTFRKLGRQPLPRRKYVSEKGDWTPTRQVERPPERPVERKEEKVSPSMEKDSGKRFFGCREPRDTRPEKIPEENLDNRLQEKQAAREAEKASMRLEARLKKEHIKEENMHSKPQQEAQEKSRVQEKPKVQEKVISRDKHTTIFASFDEEERKNTYPSGRGEKPRKTTENRDKRKKLDEAMEIDLPDNYDEEFWS